MIDKARIARFIWEKGDVVIVRAEAAQQHKETILRDQVIGDEKQPDRRKPGAKA